MPIKIWLLIGFAAVVALAAWHYKATLDENKALTEALKKAGITVDAMDENARTVENIYDRERKNTDEIDKAPSADDGPISPVLRRTLGRM